jgi:hypothetical protein
MIHLQMMIDKLSRRADESDLVVLLATSREARLYNADLARELHDVVKGLRKELDHRWGVGIPPTHVVNGWASIAESLGSRVRTFGALGAQSAYSTKVNTPKSSCPSLADKINPTGEG